MDRDARRDLIVEMHDGGAPFREIGKALGISNARASQVYWAAKYGRRPQALSTRTLNCLHNMGLIQRRDDMPAVLDVMVALPRLRRAARPDSGSDAKNFGARSLAEIEVWLVRNGQELPQAGFEEEGKAN